MNKDSLNAIVKLLRDNNFDPQAKQLETLASRLYIADEREKERVGEEIRQMCHPRWLGDVFIHGISHQEWYELLDRLNRSI